MISNIAHQWRQPLSELSSILMYIKFKYSINALDSKIMEQKTQEADKVLDICLRQLMILEIFYAKKREKKSLLFIGLLILLLVLFQVL